MWNKVIDDWKNPVEYIDREAANLAFAEQGFDWDKAKQALASVPAADVAPVVYGHWIWHEEEFEYECSVCHCRFDYNHTFEIFDHGFQYANYCPNCGAKMDGGADND